MTVALIIFGCGIAAALLYGAARYGDQPERDGPAVRSRKPRPWHRRDRLVSVPQVSHDEYAPVSLLPSAGLAVHAIEGYGPPELLPAPVALPAWAVQDGDRAPTDVPSQPAPAGDEDPGPGGLPEGDTAGPWPPQETAGPGDSPLAKARAAMDAVAALGVSDYLGHLGAATAYDGDAPWNPLSADTIARGMAAIKAEVA